MRSRAFLALGVVFVLLLGGCAAVPTATPTASGLAVDPGMSRDEAIERLVAETFLPADKAGCVIDAVFLGSGVYNPNSDTALAAVDQSELVARCTEVDEEFVAPERDESAPLYEVDELEIETGDLEITVVERFELTEATMPALNPGGVAVGEVALGGKTIEYVTITPPGFQMGDLAPVFFALPPGGQDLEITQNVALAVYANQAVARGWVVVTPASPGGVWYDDDNTAIVPEFVAWMKAWVAMEGGKPHIGGMSNGGLSAFHIALQDPSQYHSLLAFPGYPPSAADRKKVSDLAGIPVYMWVGGQDTSWVESMDATAADIRLAGGSVQLNVLPGEPHVLQSTQNGVAFFDALTAAR